MELLRWLLSIFIKRKPISDKPLPINVRIKVDGVRRYKVTTYSDGSEKVQVIK